MKLALRWIAVLIAVAAFLDPATTRLVSRPVAAEVVLPRSSHPDYPRALSQRPRLIADLDGAARVDDGEVPKVRLAIGPAAVPPDPSIPLVLWTVPPGVVSVEQFRAPHRIAVGQQIAVQALLRGRGLDGKTSSIRVRADGVNLATTEHRWSGSDETYTAHLAVPTLTEGVHRLQMVVATDGETVIADHSVLVSAKPQRVFVYEPRPSWPAAFARRSLEEDRSFELVTVARTAPSAATTSGDSPPVLTGSRLNEADALILGGLDALAQSEARLVLEFVSIRGGTLVLLPDRQIPDALRRALGLPTLEEVLLQEPVVLEGAATKLRASELLVPAQGSPVTTIAEFRRQSDSRPVVFAMPFGNGTVVVVGALDAWRYRSTKEQDIDGFTRALLVEAAQAAAPPLAVSLVPSIERPGEPVAVVATLRETELVRNNGRTTVPSIAASLIDGKGARETVRLWPTSRVGEFAGEVRAAREGRYVVEVTAGSRRAEDVLTIAGDVTHARNAEYPAAAAAALTGGGVYESLGDVRTRVAAERAVPEPVRVHPMRSAWWIVPFAGLLSTEWILRRRAGLR